MSLRRGPVGIGIIGAGVIAAQYLTQFAAMPDLDVRAVGDLRPEAAAARAREYGVPRHGSVETVLDDPEIEIVVNLTIPAAHCTVSRDILEAGKHVWTEKPLVTTREEAQTLLALAARSGLRIGSAPDTVLGAGIQTGLRALQAGEIGTPRSALAQMRSCGPESWHPNPDFLFQRGAGPLFDIGPYYLTALVLALGPVASVSAVGSRISEARTIGSGPRAGESFAVEVPTRVQGLLRFTAGAVAAVEFSFDDALDRPPVLELAGTAGTLDLPDPNEFSGLLGIAARGDEDWTERESAGAVAGRGLGTLEMARALRADRPHRLTGELAAHVLDVMISLEDATRTGATLPLATTTAVPAPMPVDFDPEAATL